MKPKLRPLTTLAGSLVLLVGCDQNKPGVSQTPPETGSAADTAKKEIQQAAVATKEFLLETKDQFVAAAEPKLKSFGERIDELGKKAEGLTDEAKADSSRLLDLTREKRAQAATKLEELKQAGQDTWRDIKAGFESAMSDLEKAYEDAKTKLSD